LRSGALGMIRRYRLFAVHLLAVLLPCAVIGLLGYKWLELEREAEVRRGQDAAEAEAADLRRDLVDRLATAALEVAQKYAGHVEGRPPFALPPSVPEIVDSAYLFTPEGKLIYPDYEAAYRRAISAYQSAAERPEWQGIVTRAEMLEARSQVAPARRVLLEFMPQARSLGLESSVNLHLGRLSLEEKQYGDAELNAREILRCCAGTRDEYGVSFALYAAGQIASAWEAQGVLRARFPQLASQITDLIRAGQIGYPGDLLELSALLKKVNDVPDAADLLRRAEQTAGRIAAHIENGKRLEKWVSGSTLVGRSAPRFSLTTLRSGEKAQVVGLYRGSGSDLLLTSFATDPLAAYVSARAAERGRFEALVVPTGNVSYGTALQTVLLPEAPGFDLVLQARESDPGTHQRRQRLFAGALVAAVLLVLLVGYFAFRDFSRELQLASLRSNFVAGVTHDLKTPLTAIRMLAETLQLGRTRDPAVSEQILGTIVNESERLTRLLDNVLTFAKIEKGGRAYRPEEIDLSATVLGAARRFDYVLEQEGFHLSTETGGDRLLVKVDADALTQALLNLLSNAVKYSGKSREIHLSIHARGDEAEICVLDHGIGIPRSEQRRIFESFYRVPEAARETSGAGLGLALVRHFAEAHGGRVTVSSEPGKGSTFSLWLPLVKKVSSGGGRLHKSILEDDHGEDSHR